MTVYFIGRLSIREASWMEISPWAVQRLVYERLGVEFEVSPHEVEAVFLRSARSWSPEPGISLALSRLSARHPHEWVQRRAQQAAENIRKGKKGRLEDLEGDVDKLRKDLEKLWKKLDDKKK